jgi:hypothetical protein
VAVAASARRAAKSASLERVRRCHRVTVAAAADQRRKRSSRRPPALSRARRSIGVRAFSGEACPRT